MNPRKVLEMGGGTLLISLPKHWAVRNGLRKGATVAVEELSDRKLLVRPMEQGPEKPREILLEYPGEDLTQATNALTGAYLFGYDLIRMGGTKVISREDRAHLKSTMSRLIGLEIMDEDSKHITMQFLLEASAINPERIVRRMAGILEGMIKDTSEAASNVNPKLLSLVSERDDEVDRLYFLLVRTLRTSTLHPEVAEEYGLTPVDALDYRVLASFLESVGDAVAELSNQLRRSKLPRTIRKELVGCLSALREMEDLSIQSFLTRKSGRSIEAFRRFGELSASVTESLGRISHDPGLVALPVVETVGPVERINKLLVDISDLAVTNRLVQ